MSLKFDKFSGDQCIRIKPFQMWQSYWPDSSLIPNISSCPSNALFLLSYIVAKKQKQNRTVVSALCIKDMRTVIEASTISRALLQLCYHYEFNLVLSQIFAITTISVLQRNKPSLLQKKLEVTFPSKPLGRL